MTHEVLAFIGFLEIAALWILPMYVSYRLCKKRGRDTTKGIFVSFCTGWIGTVIIWLFLADKSSAHRS
jgi:hypothetical protein